MGGRNCCVKNCRRRSHDHHGRKLPNGLTFHCFPAWRTNEGGQISELTRRRRAAWVAAVGRSDITFDSIPSSMRVCSRHFYSGRPAYEMLESDPDWAPSLNLGHNDGNLRRAERVPLSVQTKKKQKQKMILKKRPVVAFTAPQTQSEDGFPPLHLDQHEEDSGPADYLLLSMKSKNKQIKKKKTETRPTATSTTPQTQSEAAEDWVPFLHLDYSEGNSLSVKSKKKRIKRKNTAMSTTPQIQSEAAEDWVPSLYLDLNEGNSLSVKSKKKAIKRKKTETRPAETFKVPQTQSEAAEDWVSSLHLDYNDGNLLSVKSKEKQIKKKKTETRPTETSTTPQTQSEAAGDWAPSLHLDYDEENLLSVKSKKKQIKREKMETRPAETSTTPQTQSEAAEGFKKPSVPPWRDVKSVLQSLIQINTNVSKKPEDETVDRPAANNTELSFRDFFRNALEASLEASIRSRAQSKASSSNSELTVELNLQVPPLKGKSDASSSSLPVSSSSSSCLNCVRLQRRVEELKEKLSQFAGEQEDMEASAAWIKPEQNPETIHEIEVVVPEWSELLSPDQVVQHDDSKASPSGQKRRPPLRFRKEWLSMFWFLRYSPSLDHMWCHVCRLHASSMYHKLALIKGSRVFKMDSIKKHSNTNYHKENLEQYVKSGNRISYQILL
uniref:THAP-type domain-containing protein n=1 Tax=Amphiprion percula TaxID=161767 RepID=A0A3P8RR23_AMPPE